MLRSLVACLVLCLLGAFGAPEALAQTAPEPRGQRVLVELAVTAEPEARLGRRALGRQRAAIAAAQERLETELPGARRGAIRRFRRLPYLALEVDEQALAHLRRSPFVRSVVPDRLYAPSLDESAVLIGAAPPVGQANGSSYAVAVLDTGVDPSHPALAGRLVNEACFSANGDCPGGGVEEYGPGAASDCPFSGCFHGTHVAGIVASSDAVYAGVAPAVLVVPIQVFSSLTGPVCDDFGEDPCTLSYVSDQIAALEYVLDLAATLDIAAVNLSLGGDEYTSTAACDAANAATKTAIDDLRALGIPTLASSGNDGFLDAMHAPACISSAVSVGATTKTDGIASFSNSASFLSLLAPGASITSSAPLSLGYPFGAVSGTSMAAPHVAGAWAVMRSAKPQGGVSELLSALQASGLEITDVNSVTTARIDVYAALGLLWSPDCGDGIDNDGDGLLDFPADPGCASADAAREDPACNDGSDNDGDQLVDLADPHCVWAALNSESPAPCGLSFELVPPLAGLMWLRRRRLRRPRTREPRGAALEREG